jgi:hypothetical protein
MLRSAGSVSPSCLLLLATDRTQGAATVDVAQCRAWLGTLAGPEFEGRGTGQPGYQKAADYVAAHFKALGLEARGENGGYFQNVPWSSVRVAAEASSVAFVRDGKAEHTIPAARLSGSISSGIEIEAGAVLLRPAVRKPGTTTSAEPAAGAPANPPPEAAGGRRRISPIVVEGLADLELKGKVAILVLPEFGDDRMAAANARFAALRELQGKECAAVLFAQKAAITDGLRGRSGGARGGNRAAAGAGRAPFEATFGADDVRALLATIGQQLDQLDALPVRTDLPGSLRIKMVTEEVQAPAMNVFAVLPGSDPKLRDEYVMIGSHLDHLGRSGDTIRPGADDDGSGTTGVMAIAQMFAKNGQRPARSLLFACFSGEEAGLQGSRYFAEHCPVPLASIVAELQLDMIGRDEEQSVEGNKGEKAEDNRNSLHLIGTEKLAPALHQLCLERNTTAKFDLEWDEEGMFSRSDHANFARRGVPIAFFFTGLHRDYHMPSDTPDKIHYEKLLRVAGYVYDIAFELAVRPDRPTVAPELWKKYRDKASELPAAPLTPPAPEEVIR